MRSADGSSGLGRAWAVNRLRSRRAPTALAASGRVIRAADIQRTQAATARPRDQDRRTRMTDTARENTNEPAARAHSQAPQDSSAHLTPRDSGAYVLLLDIPTSVEITVGRLGSVRFQAGRYVYVGSARRNLRARVERHLRREKRVRWHIDYLTTDPGVHPIGAVLAAGPSDECRISRALASLEGSTAPVPAFGASDCTRGCRAHLYRVAGARSD